MKCSVTVITWCFTMLINKVVKCSVTFISNHWQWCICSYNSFVIHFLVQLHCPETNYNYHKMVSQRWPSDFPYEKTGKYIRPQLPSGEIGSTQIETKWLQICILCPSVNWYKDLGSIYRFEKINLFTGKNRIPEICES